MKNKIIIILTLMGWFSVSLYFGVGGYVKIENQQELEKTSDDSVKITYNDIIFSNSRELEAYIQDTQTSRIFPWLNEIPGFMGIMLTACAFGVLGGFISLIKQIAIEGKALTEVKYISIPLLGFLTGVVVLGLTYLVPTLLISNENELRPTSLMFISLFSGIYSTRFYKYLSSISNKILKNEK